MAGTFLAPYSPRLTFVPVEQTNIPEGSVSTQASTMNIGLANENVGTWRSKSLAIFLMVVTGGIFGVNSRYRAWMNGNREGRKISAKGGLKFGTYYAVDGTMPLRIRVYRTPVNWFDAIELE